MNTMRTVKGLVAGSVSAAILLAAPAFAQQTDDGQMPPPAVQPDDGANPPAETPRKDRASSAGEVILTEQKPGQVVTDEVLDTIVVSQSEEKVGKITGLVFDDEDRIVAAIITVGGVLGIGGKDVAVRWQEVTFSPDADVAVVTAPQAQIEEARAFLDQDTQQAMIESKRQRMEMRRDQQRQMNSVPTQPIE